NNIINVGVNNKNVDLFEGQYAVPNGMAYNSYLIIDKKIVLFDTVDISVQTQWLQNLDNCLKNRQIDFLIISHMEPDHSACIQLLCNKFPNMKLIGNQKTFIMLKQFFDIDLTNKIITVSDGDTFSSGAHNFTFYFAPMVHWPEVMVTYESEEKVLFSADAFGAFGANNTNNWPDEARRYYINIVGKFGAQVASLLKKLSGVKIESICPLHGAILNENLSYYLNLYSIWSGYQAEENGVFIAYSSIYGNTKHAVQLLEKQLKQQNILVLSADLARTDFSQNIANAFKFSKIVFATTTYNGSIFPVMEDFLNHLKMLNFQNRKVWLIENGSWSPQAVKNMRAKLETFKNITISDCVVSIQSAVNSSNLAQINNLATDLINK
ncbi:MAG: MBL fold metallo-hydrolase, partial [Clostridia bacterium]